MKKVISRRQVLGIGVAGLAGGLTLNQHGADAQTFDAPAANAKSDRRSYWQKSYSGGPVDVKPLAPGLPGKDYTPVVVPNGAALPFKIVGGVKVFHLDRRRNRSCLRFRLARQVLGIQRQGERHGDRSGRRRAGADLRDQSFAGGDIDPLARILFA